MYTLHVLLYIYVFYVMYHFIPESILVTDRDGWKHHGVVVVDFDVDGHRPRQIVHDACDDLDSKHNATAQKQK